MVTPFHDDTNKRMIVGPVYLGANIHITYLILVKTENGWPLNYFSRVSIDTKNINPN